MSSAEQPLDPHLIEQTKQQIRSLVGEIAQLAKAEIAPEEFYGEFLPRVVSALAAEGGAIWTLNPEGQLALQYQVELHKTNLRDREEAQAQHGRLLYKALASPDGMLVPPHSGPGGDSDDQAANPTDFLVLLGLMKTDLETVGVVEVFQRAESGPSTQKGYLRFLMQMCELAGDYLKSHQLRHFSDRQTLWTQLEVFAHGVHASLDPRATAYTIANEGRRLIECDRLSVAIRRGNKCTIEAISGQDLFDKRSNTVRLLGKLASAVVASGDPVWYTGDTRDMPPQVEDAVQEYVDEAHSKTVAVLPLRRPAPLEEDDPNKRTEPEPPIGALIVEQIEDSRVPASMAPRVDVVCRHSSAALANSLDHQNLFLMPVWRALGKTRWVVQGRTLPKTLSITGAVLAVILLLAIWPAELRLEGRGSMEPVVRQDVFAGIDGVVQVLDAKCDHGATVEKGQRLAQLRNTDLEVALTDVTGQRLTTGKRISTLTQMLSGGRLTSEERSRLEGEMAEANQKMRTLDAQLDLYKAKEQELEVKSPINGLIVTWDLRNRLIHRPVQRGQVLLRVADPEGPWQLELRMPENRMGHITKAQQAKYDKSREKLRELLRAEKHSRVGDASPAEEVDQAVDTELATIADFQLRGKILDIFRSQTCAQIQQIAADVTDEALRAKLDAIAGEKSYDALLAKLGETLPEVEAADPDLYARLNAIPKEQWDDRLEVTYILATEPGTTHYGRVKEIHRSAEVRGEEGNTVLIKVEIDKSDVESHLRPGATVTAKVDCGRATLGYVLLHDVIAFVQSRILFRYF